MRADLADAGFDLEDTQSAILPIVIGDERRALEMGRAVRARGLFCQTVVFPGVPLGDARLRVSVTSEHTPRTWRSPRRSSWTRRGDRRPARRRTGGGPVSARRLGVLDESVAGLPDVESAEHAARPALVGRRTITYGARRHGGTGVRRAPRAGRAARRPRRHLDGQRPEYAEAILAALRVGCAYVPIDGGQPSARAGTILQDARPIVLFTDRRHLALLSGTELGPSVRAIVVTDGVPPGSRAIAWETFLKDADTARERPRVTPSDLAAIHLGLDRHPQGRQDLAPQPDGLHRLGAP